MKIDFLNNCYNIEWNFQIKEQTISPRRENHIKLPDAIIAASSMVYNIPLVTADKEFEKVRDIDLILPET